MFLIAPVYLFSNIGMPARSRGKPPEYGFTHIMCFLLGLLVLAIFVKLFVFFRNDTFSVLKLVL
jgi:hypothetical protein